MRTNHSTQKNGPSQKIRIATKQLRPLLDEGRYLAQCISASCDWSTKWKKHQAILKFKPTNYTGKPFYGDLCRFFYAGRNQDAQQIGPSSALYRLLVAVNGAQPISEEFDLNILTDQFFYVEIRTVTHKSDKDKTPIPPEQWYSVVGEVEFVSPNNPENPQNTSNPRNLSNPNNTSNLGKPRNPENLSTYREPFEPIQPSNTSTPSTFSNTKVPMCDGGRSEANTILNSSTLFWQ